MQKLPRLNAGKSTFIKIQFIILYNSTIVSSSCEIWEYLFVQKRSAFNCQKPHF